MEKVGKYQIVELIGSGGFSEVYKGFDPHIKRHVAIKMCTARDAELRSRFFQEAEISGFLQHRHIVTVFDFGFEDERPYLVQEYLTGEDLDKKIKRRETLSLSRKIEILTQVALGLGHAHDQGIIHRDIKPGNVRVTDDGAAKIMDFGIAKFLQEDTGLTRTGMTVGTAAYLAPEQIRGKKAGPATDVFSFGVMAYELLTHERPFGGEQISAVLYQILNEIPERLTARDPDCPPELAELVMRCLAKPPEDRPADGNTLVENLGSIDQALIESAEVRTARMPTSGNNLTTTLPAVEGTRAAAEGVADLALRPEVDTPPPRPIPDAIGHAQAPPRRRPWPLLLVVLLLVLGAAGLWRFRDDLFSKPQDPGAASPTTTLADATVPDGTVPAQTVPDTIGPNEATSDGALNEAQGASPAGAPDESVGSTNTEPADAAPPPPPPPPPPAKGTVVMVPAWNSAITVSVNGGTPRLMEQELRIPLTPGRHTLRFAINLDGYRDRADVPVEVRPGGVHAVSLPFPQPGGLTVQARPGTAGGRIFLEGNQLGEGRSVDVGFLKPGVMYQVEVRPPDDSSAPVIRAGVTIKSLERTIFTYHLGSDAQPSVHQSEINPSDLIPQADGGLQ